MTIAAVVILSLSSEDRSIPVSEQVGGETGLDATVPVENGTSSDAGGIGFNEADERGVLYGEYDMLATTASSDIEAGEYVFNLQNVGQKTDSYLLAVDVPDGASAELDQDMLDLESGQSAKVRVVLTMGDPDSIDLVVKSEGLNGAEIVRLPLSWSN